MIKEKKAQEEKKANEGHGSKINRVWNEGVPGSVGGWGCAQENI